MKSLILSLLCFVSALSVRGGGRTTLPHDYQIELAKISDPTKRAEMTEAVVVWLDGISQQTGGRDEVLRKIMNSQERELLYLLVTNHKIGLGYGRFGEYWADRDPQLLTRAMLFTIADNDDNPVGQRHGEGYVSRLSQSLVRVARENGGSIALQDSYFVRPTWVPAKAVKWLEDYLERAIRESIPGSDFRQQMEECLKIVQARRGYADKDGTSDSVGSKPIVAKESTVVASTSPTPVPSNPMQSVPKSVPTNDPWFMWAGGITAVAAVVLLIVRRFR